MSAPIGNSLYRLPALASRYMAERGWTQGQEEDDDGRVCLTGALRLCSPVPGDYYIAREVFRHWEHAEVWNDTEGRTAEEVVWYLAATQITNYELSVVFGPQWHEITTLVRAICGLTQQQMADLAAAHTVASRSEQIRADLAFSIAWGAALRARQAHVSAATASAVWEAAWDATEELVLTPNEGYMAAPARGAIRNSALALCTRHLIGTDKYTQEHYDLITGPWRKVVGPLHTDDTQPLHTDDTQPLHTDDTQHA